MLYSAFICWTLVGVSLMSHWALYCLILNRARNIYTSHFWKKYTVIAIFGNATLVLGVAPLVHRAEPMHMLSVFCTAMIVQYAILDILVMSYRGWYGRYDITSYDITNDLKIK
jgi:hypothetical protein